MTRTQSQLRRFAVLALVRIAARLLFASARLVDVAERIKA
jgi:hypothetical protein